MPRKTKAWKAEKVTLEPYQISKEKQKLLLTELAQIFYDLSCQFHKTSSDATSLDKSPLLGPSNRRSAS